MSDPSFAERHADTISKLIVALIVLCVVAIPVTFWVNHQDVGSVNKRVTRIESPCLRFGPKSRPCRRSFEQAVLTVTHAEACAILRKAGLEIRNCAGARLAQEKGRNEERTATEAEGGEAQQPSHHHTAPQQPGPPSGGSHEQGGTSDRKSVV